jgi:hypothetical protein
VINIKKIIIEEVKLITNDEVLITYNNIEASYDHIKKIIHYHEPDELNTLVSIYLFENNIVLERTNDEIYMSYQFYLNDKTPCIINVKKYNINLEGSIKTNKLVLTNDNISVNYILYIDNEISSCIFKVRFREE